MGYKRDVVKGVTLIGALRFFSKAVGLIEILILARILTPNQFGSYSIVLITLGLLEILSETGVNIFLLQEEEIDKYINTAWMTSIIRGILISIIIFSFAPLISAFFNSKELISLLKLVAVVPLLRGFINPSIVKFQKNLEFKKNFFYQIGILIIDTFISVVVTYVTKSPVGIIMGLISGVIFELIISFSFIKPIPKVEFNGDYFKKIIHRGKWITANGLFDYLFHNFDNLVVGRILGTPALGVYQLAYSISVLPLDELGKVFVHVSTPVFVKIPEDKERLKNAYLKIFLVILSISILVVLFILFFPNIFVYILGSKWKAIGNILFILAVLGLIKGVAGSASALFISQKKQKYLTYSSVTNFTLLAITIIPLTMKFGLVGTSLACLLGAVFALPVISFCVMKILRVSDSY